MATNQLVGLSRTKTDGDSLQATAEMARTRRQRQPTPTPDVSDPALIVVTSERNCCEELPALRISAEEADTLAAMFKAISHPVRLQIVDLLSRYSGQVCVCDIEGHFELSQPTISHHLKILRQAQLIESENRGIWVYYHIRPEAVARLQSLLSELKP